MLAKLPRANPDGVVLDLEDAVAPNAKADAREHSREAGAMLAREHPNLAVYIRVNARLTEWFDDDVARGVPAGAIGIVVPKVESAADVQAAAHAGVLSLDQVVTELREEEVFRLDALLGRSLGYRGKLCIHPTQVGWANESFSPSPTEVERARRLIDAFDHAAAAGHGTIAFEGQMVDEPLARRARAVIAGAAEE